MHAHPSAMACIRDCYAHFERHTVPTHDGGRLTTYEAGPPGAPVVVIISPIGVPLLVVSRLALQLASRHRVVCWEQRGFAEDSVNFLDTAHEYVDYVADVLDVVSQRADSLAAVIGVCSGASLAIKAAALAPMQPQLILVSPAIFFRDGYIPSQFDTSVVPFMRMIDGTNRGLAEDLFDLRMSSRRTNEGPEVTDLEVMDAADTLSVSSIDSLLVYSRIVRVFTDQKLDRELASTRSPVHVFATQDDATVSIRSTRRLCQLLPDAVLHEFSQGGHFSLYTRRDVRDAIGGLVDRGLKSHAAPLERAVGR